MPFAAALSEHPLATEAVGEVVGQVLDALGDEPDLAVVFATGPHVGAFGEIAETVRAGLRPGALAGTTAVSVVGGEREVEEQPALALWAARLPPVEVLRLDAVRTADGIAILGLDDRARRASTLLLLADPMTFPTDELVDHCARELPGTRVIGGMASAGFARGANRLVLDGEVFDDGAIAVAFGAGHDIDLVVSQGCRPIGEPFTVTSSDGNAIHEIAGQPALRRLEGLFASLGEHERRLVQEGLHLGRVIDEHKVDFERGDFLVRNIVGADRGSGALVVGDAVEVGATIQFHVRDAVSADEDLRALLAGHDADAALLFTCNGRGMRLFGRPDHDAELVSNVAGSRATAGMFCAGEVGPVGTRSFVHGFTASVALFHDPPGGAGGSAPERATGGPN